MKTIDLASLPPIGKSLDGGTFAGLTTKPDGTHCAVVLLPGNATDLTWTKAKAWAKKQGGELPSRPVAALLFANVKANLKPKWHWTSEEYDASYAWLCNFLNGTQYDIHKSFEGSAVAVRQITLAASPEVPARKPLAQVNRYCSAGMCLATDREHEADCPRAASPAAPAAPVVPLTDERITKALRRAFSLGQTYWQQADSDSYKQNAKSDETRQKFETLIVETLNGITGGSK